MNDERTSQAIYATAHDWAAHGLRGLVVTCTGRSYHRPACRVLAQYAKARFMEPMVAIRVLRDGEFVYLEPCPACSPPVIPADREEDARARFHSTGNDRP